MKRILFLILLCFFGSGLTAQGVDSSQIKAGRLMEESGARYRRGMTFGLLGSSIISLSALVKSPQYDNGILVGYDYTPTILLAAIGGALMVTGYYNLYESGRLTKKAGWFLQGGKPR